MHGKPSIVDGFSKSGRPADVKMARDRQPASGYRGRIPSRTARKRGNADSHSSFGVLAISRIAAVPPPNTSHCTTVTGLLDFVLVASIRVSYPGDPLMRIGSDMVIC